MKTIKDSMGREWTFALNVYEFKRTREKFGDLLDPRFFWTKTKDAVFLVDFLFALVEREAAERKIDASTFEKSFYGDALEDARQKLLEEYVDFFPSRTRPELRAAFDRVAALDAKVRALAGSVLTKMEKKVDAGELDFSDLPSNSPESPDSSPTDERSAS